MKQQMFAKLFSAIVILFCLASPARAALITTNFSDVVGNQGTVDIQFSRGNSEVVEGFQVFFSENLFSNLSISNSPVGWDSYILSLVQGALVFDNFNVAGLENGVAKLSFTYLGQTPIQELNYEFYNGNFEVTGSGVAANVKTPVPESSGLMLVLLGLLAIAVKTRIRTIISCRMAAREVAA